MANIDQRAVLERLIQERREDYASLSRLIGRNAAYIQQFIRRGTPKRLSEADRQTLARYFGISEGELGAPGYDRSAEAIGKSSLIPVPRLMSTLLPDQARSTMARAPAHKSPLTSAGFDACREAKQATCR